ncbi:unnamed protein product [Amoebophrya sp. A25]|nr:unnamed protein product [Amoebophrya sp. A25]|eukprot:GSA25T00016400001.1
MDVETSALAFFVRTHKNLKILTLGKGADPGKEGGGKLVPRELAKLPHIPKSASWSPDSQSLAVGDTQKGVVVIGLRRGKPTVQILQGSSVNTQHIWWSPTSRYLVTQHPPEKVEKGEKQKPNLLVWSAAGGESSTSSSATKDASKDANATESKSKGGPKLVASFTVPKGDGSRAVCPLFWSPDESVCVRVLPGDKGCKESVLHLLPGDDLNATPLFEIRESRTNLVAAWCPRTKGDNRGSAIKKSISSSASSSAGSSSGMQLALFVSDGRNDMQRVSEPAEVRIYNCNGRKLELVKRIECPSGESAALQWCASGDALLALVETEVDETGVSYYGSTQLVLLPADPNLPTGASSYQELSKESSVLDKGAAAKATSDAGHMPIQAVQWSPVEDVFVLIRGFQPAQVSVWKYDRLSHRAEMLSILADKSHRNTVLWNKFGSVCLIGGFGNLAGEMDFYGKSDEDKLTKMATSQASCTVNVEWSADGIHAITAVLSPRMRVENGFTIWHCLTGKARHTEPFEELYEVGLRPHDGVGSHFEGPTRLEIKNAVAACAKASSEGGNKRAAYRPPHARGPGSNAASSEVNNIKAFMLGEKSLGDSPNKQSKTPRGGGLRQGGAEHKPQHLVNLEKQEQSANNSSGDGDESKDDGAAPGAPGGTKKEQKDPSRTDKAWLRGQALPAKKSQEPTRASAGGVSSETGAGPGSTTTGAGAATSGGAGSTTTGTTNSAAGTTNSSSAGSTGSSGSTGAPEAKKTASSAPPNGTTEPLKTSGTSSTSGTGRAAAQQSSSGAATGNSASQQESSSGQQRTTAQQKSTQRSPSRSAKTGAQPPATPPPPAAGAASSSGDDAPGGSPFRPPGRAVPPAASNAPPPAASKSHGGGKDSGPPPNQNHTSSSKTNGGGLPNGATVDPAALLNGGYPVPGKGQMPAVGKGAGGYYFPAYPPPGPGDARGYPGGPPQYPPAYPPTAYGAHMNGKGMKPGPPPPLQPPTMHPNAAYGAVMPPPAAHQQHLLRAGANAMPPSAPQHLLGVPAPPSGPCPPNGWQYIDPRGNVQGPFDADEMKQWNALGYFKPELKMRFSETMDFFPFEALFPVPSVPFVSYPQLPGRTLKYL